MNSEAGYETHVFPYIEEAGKARKALPRKLYGTIG
jgi:hypothetical protein